MAQRSSKFLAALYIGIVLGNLGDLEESVIASCNIEVQLKRFKRIRKGIEVLLWFDGVEDLKGFKIKQLVARGSQRVEGIQLCCVQREFTLRTGKTSKPQGRFKIDNKDRKDQNKFKSEGSTMKRKFDIGTHVTQYESSYKTFGKLEGVFVQDNLSQAEKRNLIKTHKPRNPPLMRIRDLEQGRKLHTHSLTKGEVKIGWIWIKKEELRSNVV
ncbi:hypothetical protein M9H77_23103 [Catharanthus roseus]|uniref:Uncharacterized protein n=1 Tax=Catharanthus roseus TaxID=4058 RepID=A0ACC0ATV7_CATRO|nr:hypothetical protein M9H77_23103 [Catharanthus roseus]